MMPDHIATRIGSAGPLLFIGLLMAVDPAKVVMSLEAVSSAIRIFEHRLRGLEWRVQVVGPRPSAPSRGTLRAVRAAGAALSAFAFLFAAGILT